MSLFLAPSLRKDSTLLRRIRNQATIGGVRKERKDSEESAVRYSVIGGVLRYCLERVEGEGCPDDAAGFVFTGQGFPAQRAPVMPFPSVME